MPSQKGKRAKGVQMTEQQPKTPQIIDIVEMPPTADIVQIPATQDIVQSPPTQNGSQTPDTAQIEDILQMAAQMVDIQPLKRPLGGNIYLELTEWNGSKRVDLRWHSPYERRSELTFGSMESPVQHVGRHRRFAYQSHRKRTSRVAIPYQKRRFRDVHIRKYFITADEWTYRPTKRGVALHFGEWKELKQIIPLLEEREPELRQLVPLYRTDL